MAMLPCLAWADDTPTINPNVTYIIDNVETQGNDTTASAPLKVIFKANPEDVGSYNAYYEWRIFKDTQTSTPWLVRYEENTEFEFTESGAYTIYCYATFTLNEDTVKYTNEYWSENKGISINITTSKLEMPNAFSPNGDQINDIYKAKDGWTSIVEFKATIINRWGQKLFEWTDPNDGWDGTYNGRPVKQGVYYVIVKAKGADGTVYNIRRDVNLLRGYSEETTTTEQ